MTQNIEFSQLREQAIALRRAGKSRREIKELLVSKYGAAPACTGRSRGGLQPP